MLIDTGKRDAPTAASFLRPTQTWDRSRTFLQALTEKYVSVDGAQSGEIIYVSRSKQIEKVGFEKFAARQAELRGIHVLVLDHMQIGPHIPQDDHETITKICANITDLDISGNMFEELDDILTLCSLFPKLKRLHLDRNRFRMRPESQRCLDGIRTVSMEDTLLAEKEIEICLSSFQYVEELILADNILTTWQKARLPESLTSINLAHNSFRYLDQIAAILSLPRLRMLNLKNNDISSITQVNTSLPTKVLSSTIQDLDLARNQINSWHFFHDLLGALPALQSLRVSDNPLFSVLRSAEGNLLSAEDGYMLTIARLPAVKTLNYSTIREKDRLNAEKYYLSQIATELARADDAGADAIVKLHPRWKALCQQYGEPVIDRRPSDNIDPNSLAARLITLHLTYVHAGSSRQWTREIPRACNVYVLYGLVGKELDLMPFELRLIWETGESDPVSATNEYHGPEYWDSSDEDEAQGAQALWRARSVELVPGTRPIGTYLEGRQASIRVEFRRTVREP